MNQPTLSLSKLLFFPIYKSRVTFHKHFTKSPKNQIQRYHHLLWLGLKYLLGTRSVCLCRFADRKKQKEEAEDTTTSSTYQRRAWDSWDTAQSPRATESPVTSSSSQVVTTTCWSQLISWPFRELLGADQTMVQIMRFITQDTATATAHLTRYVNRITVFPAFFYPCLSTTFH